MGYGLIGPVVSSVVGFGKSIYDAAKGGPEAPKPLYADTTTTKRAMGEDPFKGSYADLAPTTDITQSATPFLGGQEEMGSWQQQDLQGLLQRAQGRGLIADEQGRIQQQALQAGALGQAASARGLYNPALQSAATQQASMIPSQMAAGLAAAREQEKMEALKAYNIGAGQFGQQSGAASQAWIARQAMERQRQLQQEKARQALLNIQQREQVDKAANRAEMERIRMHINSKFGDESNLGQDKFATKDTQDDYIRDLDFWET